MTATASVPEPSPARRRFLRQGQLAAAAIGGIAAMALVGLVPPRMTLVRIRPEVELVSVDVLLWLVPLLLGMTVGYVVWAVVFEHRRPSLLGRPWSGERDWAITGGLFVAYVLMRTIIPPARDRASGLYSTEDPVQFLLVDAPVDIAIVLVRFLASAAISAALLRLVFDWVDPLRTRRAT